MNKKRYTLNKVLLTFTNPDIEKAYLKQTTERTLLFCRIAWIMLVIFGAIFGLLDRPNFGPGAGTVLAVRGIFLTISGIIFLSTFSNRIKQHLHLSSFFFVTFLGFFSTFLVGMSEPTAFSPYFTSYFFVFAGIFTTVGMGFRYSVYSLILNILVFEITVGVLNPVPLTVFLPYTFFLIGILLVFAYIGYLVEIISRENYVISERLRDSLTEIKTLSNLLPICSHCKKIRDDRGYWNQIDEYFRDHADVMFSHSLCPDCVTVLHPNLKLK